MPKASGRVEMWRRLAISAGVLIGVALFCYVVPALVNITAMDWQQEQADELKSISGYVSEEDQRLSQMPLSEYIALRTSGKLTTVDAGQWAPFFQQVKMASHQQYVPSRLGNRVSEQDKDDFWRPKGTVPVYFKTTEIPYEQWGLPLRHEAEQFVSLHTEGEELYFRLRYEDYLHSVSAMSQPYRQPPGWLYHPYRTIGVGLIAAGVLVYILLPRRRKNSEDISYRTGSMVAGDVVALLLLVPFYSLPFLINGGTVQAVTGMWPLTMTMWALALLAAALLYYSAWHASYRIEVTPQALYIISWKGARVFPFNDMAEAGVVTLRNPSWFRKLFLALAFLSLMGGRASVQPAGSALLSATASYGGLEIRGRTGRPMYIWFTDQMGNAILQNFDRVPQALQNAGVPIKEDPREVEGFSMFM